MCMLLVQILSILKWLTLAAQLWIALPIIYLCVLSIAAIVRTRQSKATHQSKQAVFKIEQQIRFAILIPAHNEETVLGGLLESLRKLDYPRDSYSVHVVADNCTDTTAALVRASNWA